MEASRTLGRQQKKRKTMRKRLINDHRDDVLASSPSWLDIEQLAQVEITSEDPAFPIESALIPGTQPGWRAAHPGAQMIRLVFDAPQALHLLHLVFSEVQHERTQEFVVQGSADGGQSFREIVRQQYHFSPPGAICEVEDYHMHVEGVTTLALHIVPDIQGGKAHATLRELRLM
jgi:hypothetical protein